MAFEAKIIADSMSQEGIRLTTMQLKYPRFIHAEFMTHREFSRNASSSRAIPVAKMIQMVRDEPAMPIHWGANQPGMQADTQLEGSQLWQTKEIWKNSANLAANYAESMMGEGAHKQVVNRILEPFQWISVVMSSTSFSNFFGLRCHADAQPEIKHLAEMMQAALLDSSPEKLNTGEWHLPYITPQDWTDATHYCQKGRITRDMPNSTEVLEILKRVSAARCARVSYLTHEGKPTHITDDLTLFERLVGAQPLHASPTEHQATPDRNVKLLGLGRYWDKPQLHGNFTGWNQHRKFLFGEYITTL
jgi:hypothetical protein